MGSAHDNANTSRRSISYDKYRGLLEELRDRLLAEHRRLSDNVRSMQRSPGEDLADQGTEDLLKETDLVLATQEQRVLRLIEDAFERMEQGVYGTCVDCGGPISEARLEAIPYAKLCVRCKELRERNDGLPPDFEQRDYIEELVE